MDQELCRCCKLRSAVHRGCQCGYRRFFHCIATPVCTRCYEHHAVLGKFLQKISSRSPAKITERARRLLRLEQSVSDLNKPQSETEQVMRLILAIEPFDAALDEAFQDDLQKIGLLLRGETNMELSDQFSELLAAIEANKPRSTIKRRWTQSHLRK